MSFISKWNLSLGNLGRKGRDCCSVQEDSRKDVPTEAFCFPKELPRAFTQGQRLHQCLQQGSAKAVRGEQLLYPCEVAVHGVSPAAELSQK